MNIDDLKSQLKGCTTEEGIHLLDAYIADHPEDDEAYLLRGMRHWGLQHRSAAINDYLSAIRLNPESKAREALRAANEILDYRNTDLINP
ncbi:MAG: hypothetical protein HDT02_02435 [Bacteroidales bacterium]|nr:hypothetical protein [Bacteroidales bacterium]